MSTEALFEVDKGDSAPSKPEYAPIFQIGKNKTDNKKKIYMHAHTQH